MRAPRTTDRGHASAREGGGGGHAGGPRTDHRHPPTVGLRGLRRPVCRRGTERGQRPQRCTWKGAEGGGGGGARFRGVPVHPPPPTRQSLAKGDGGGGGGVWNPKLCVPKIAQINISFRNVIFPLMRSGSAPPPPNPLPHALHCQHPPSYCCLTARTCPHNRCANRQ